MSAACAMPALEESRIEPDRLVAAAKELLGRQ